MPNNNELVIISSLPLGGARTLAEAGLPLHYQLSVAELAAESIGHEDTPNDPFLRYTLARNMHPVDLSDRLNKTIEDNKLSHVAISGCVSQAQIEAIKANYIQKDASICSIWLQTPERTVLENFLSRSMKTGVTNPLIIRDLLTDAWNTGMADIRSSADAEYASGRIGGNTSKIMENFLAQVIREAA